MGQVQSDDETEGHVKGKKNYVPLKFKSVISYKKKTNPKTFLPESGHEGLQALWTLDHSNFHTQWCHNPELQQSVKAGQISTISTSRIKLPILSYFLTTKKVLEGDYW